MRTSTRYMEEMVIGLQKLLFAMIFTLAAVGLSSANDVYLAQTAQGGNTGADCADALVYTYFNTSSDWTSGTPTGTQIGPGTTVHLCGTFTAQAGTSGYLTAQGSGMSGSPITIHFETNAVMQAPYWSNGSSWGAAIELNGKNYITVDGGTNGLIQATANGTGLTYQEDYGGGVEATGSNNIVQNLTVANIYVHSCTLPVSNCTDEGGQNTMDILLQNGTNDTIQNNTLHDAKYGVFYTWSTSSASGLQISDNTVYNYSTGIVIAQGGTGGYALSTANLFGNVLHAGTSGVASGDWSDANGTNHVDGFHIWALNTGNSISGLNIYNNYVYGYVAQKGTSPIYVESANAGESGSITGLYIFNNVVNVTAGINDDGGIFNLTNGGGHLYNNTMVDFASCCYGSGYDTDCMSSVSGVCPGLGAVLENNIWIGDGTNNTYNQKAIYNTEGDGTIATSNYNLWYNLPTTNAFVYGDNWYGGLAAFASATGFEANSITGNPQISSSCESATTASCFVPGSDSAAIGAGTNLYSVCNGQPNPGLGALCYDAAGNVRPLSGNWTMGAYISDPPPSPPTGLQATVQ